MSLKLVETTLNIRMSGTEEDMRAVSDKLRYRPEKYYMSAQYVMWLQTKGEHGWDGWIRLFKKQKGEQEYCILRGHKDRLLAACQSLGVEVDTSSSLFSSPFHAMSEQDIPSDVIVADFELADYQKSGIVLWLRNSVCSLHVSVSGGKTAMFMAAFSLLKQRFPAIRGIYITPTERLVTQVQQEAKKFIPSMHVTRAGGGERDFSGKDLVICTVAMLSRNFESLKKEKFFDTFKALLYDESHHAASATSEKIIKAIPAVYKLGATDSKKEYKPDQSMKMEALLGPFVNSVGADVLLAKNMIARPHIYVVDIPQWRGKFNAYPAQAVEMSACKVLYNGVWQDGVYVGPAVKKDEHGDPVFDEAKGLPIRLTGYHSVKTLDGLISDYTTHEVLLSRAYDMAIVRFRERNALIAEWVSYYVAKNMRTLVVCTRSLHAHILENVIKKAVPTVKIKTLLGDSTTNQRNATFDWFRQTPASVLITPLVKEGVSINEIEAGVVADYIADRDYANQIIGRFIRKKKNTDRAYITWFLERQHVTMARNSTKLLKELGDKEAYVFYHPLASPSSIKNALVFNG